MYVILNLVNFFLIIFPILDSLFILIKPIFFIFIFGCDKMFGGGDVMKDYFKCSDEIYFVFPIEGDCININDGFCEENEIKIQAVVSAPSGHIV